MDSMRTKLASLEYPGRLIVIGAAPAGGRAVIIYAITGRSPSSQARRFVLRDGGIWVEPTDEATLKQGHVDLLVYPAVLFSRAGLAVSNGKQTTDVRDRLAPSAGTGPALAAALASWDFEPDAPIFTPRISGCLAGGAAGETTADPGREDRRIGLEVPGGQGRSERRDGAGAGREPVANVGRLLAVRDGKARPAEQDGRINEEVDVTLLQGGFVGRLDPDPAVAQDKAPGLARGRASGDGVDDHGPAAGGRRADDDEPSGVFE